MTSSDTNALMARLTDAVKAEANLTATSFETIYVGKDKYSLSILQMAHIDGEILSSTIIHQTDVHSTSNLISVISYKMWIYITAAFVESSRVKHSAVSSMKKFEIYSG